MRMWASAASREFIMSAESSYLIRLLHAYVAQANAAPPVATPLDWYRLAALVRERRLTSTLAALLSRSAAPDDIKRMIHEAAREARHHTLASWLELSRIAVRLGGTDGVDWVLLKGPALALTAYPSTDERFSVDLDILVRREDLARTRSLLGSLGYTHQDGKIPDFFYQRYHYHSLLLSPSGIRLELHWDLARVDDFARFDLDGCVARSITLELAGHPVVAFAPEDQLLHASHQAMCERFGDPRRLVDAALLLRRGVSASLLEQLARPQGLSTALWMMLRLQRELTGTVVPDGLESSLRPRPLIRRSLEALGPAESLVGFVDNPGRFHRELIRSLCAPRPGAALENLRRYLSVSEAELLEMGHQPGNLPSRRHRARLAFGRASTLLCETGRLAGRVLLTPGGRQPGQTRRLTDASPPGPPAAQPQNACGPRAGGQTRRSAPPAGDVES
jgi:hypothetical protein